MNNQEFEMVARLLKERSGLVVTAEKAYLLDNRLQPVARRFSLDGVDALVSKLGPGGDEKLKAAVVEAMTTNESLFFRDLKPFDQLRDIVLPKMLEARAATKRIRIWSAACSSGQEPYSIAMLIEEQKAKFAGWKIEITATDLSNEMLEKARTGIYSQFEVQRGLPITMLVKYFTQQGERWQINQDLRSKIQFKEFNLLKHPKLLGKFDIVFCRNVLIYFDQPTKAQVLSGIADVLEPDGAMYLGGAETVLGISNRFEPVPEQRGAYRVSGGGVRASA